MSSTSSAASSPNMNLEAMKPNVLPAAVENGPVECSDLVTSCGFGHPDPDLQVLVGLADRLETETAITVVTRGGIVTGRLIGVREYYRLWHELWRALGEHDCGIIGRTWLSRSEQILETLANEEDDSPALLPAFIHIKAARWVIGSAIVPEADTMLWRGRISEVVGFTIGSLSFKPTQAVPGKARGRGHTARTY